MSSYEWRPPARSDALPVHTCRGCEGTSPRRADATWILKLSVFRLSGRIGSDADQRISQCCAHVTFIHDCRNHAGLALIGDDQIHDGIAWIFAHGGADLRKGHSFVLPQFGIQYRRDHYTIAAAGAVPLVLPRGNVR